MQVGQKVVCIDGNFPGPIRKIYSMLPVEGDTYTVRAIYIGRSVMHRTKHQKETGEFNGEVGILLMELRNPMDPNAPEKELGFRDTRFKSVDEQTEEKKAMKVQMNSLYDKLGEPSLE